MTYLDKLEDQGQMLNSCSVQESPVCCCIDVGTVIDNKNCTASYQQIFSSQIEAESMLKNLVTRARQLESDPCLIDSKFKSLANGVELSANFTFSCQIESINFQLALR